MGPVLRVARGEGRQKVKVGGVRHRRRPARQVRLADKFCLGRRRAGFGFCDVVFGWDMADELYDNAQVTGWHTGYPDAQARVDLATARNPVGAGTAAFLLGLRRARRHALSAVARASSCRRVAQRAPRSWASLPMFGARVRVLHLPRDAAARCTKKGFQNLEPLTPGMFGYSWLRTSQNARAGARAHRRLQRLRRRDRGPAHRDRPRRLRGRDPLRRCSRRRRTRPRSSRRR